MFMVSSLARADQEGIGHCRTIADAQQRLACYDRLAEGKESQPGSASTVTAPPAGSAQIEPEAVQAFGAESMPRPPAAEITDLDARIAGNIDGLHKGQTLTLDNGQIWLCVDYAAPDDLQTQSPRVHIWRNFLGNYWMRFEDSGVSIRVRRLR
jgi:hypothetical protein